MYFKFLPLIFLCITWTAPGDDGYEGIAYQYDIRYSQDSLSLINDFTQCIILENLPLPDTSGTRQYYQVYGVLDTFYVAIRTSDEALNWSGISNVVKLITEAASVDDIPIIVKPPIKKRKGWGC